MRVSEHEKADEMKPEEEEAEVVAASTIVSWT